MGYEVHFWRADDCVVYAPITQRQEVSLLHRGRDGSWHCALCDSVDCRHTEAAQEAESDPVREPLRAH